jgi:hypothetical protein
LNSLDPLIIGNNAPRMQNPLQVLSAWQNIPHITIAPLNSLCLQIIDSISLRAQHQLQHPSRFQGRNHMAIRPGHILDPLIINNISQPMIHHVRLQSRIEDSEHMKLARFDLRQWIFSPNKPVNEVSMRIHQLERRAAALLGDVRTSMELTIQSRECHCLSESHQIDFIEEIEILDLPTHPLGIFHGDPLIAIRHLDASLGRVNDPRYSAIAMQSQTVMMRLEDGIEVTLLRIPLENSLNRMTFRRGQFPLRLVFAETVHRAHRMTLDHAVIDCRSEFCKLGQISIGLSPIVDLKHFCILLLLE